MQPNADDPRHRGTQQQHETGTFAGHPFLKIVSG
jgi:hypothetical protein